MTRGKGVFPLFHVLTRWLSLTVYGFNYRYWITDVLITPFRAAEDPFERGWNQNLTRHRVAIEQYFGTITMQFAHLAHHRQVRQEATRPGLHYLVAVLITNVRSCMYPNLIAKKYHCQPPPPAVYLAGTKHRQEDQQHEDDADDEDWEDEDDNFGEE